MTNRKSSSLLTLTSVAEIIRWLGGTAKAAAYFGHSDTQLVQEYLRAGVIPNGWHYRLHLRVSSSGATILPAAFGYLSNGDPITIPPTPRKVKVAKSSGKPQAKSAR